MGNASLNFNKVHDLIYFGSRQTMNIECRRINGKSFCSCGGDMVTVVYIYLKQKAKKNA